MTPNKERPHDPEHVRLMPLAARNIQQFLQSKIFTNLTADVLLQSGMKR